MRNAVFAMLAACALSACAGNMDTNAYKGADAGTVILSLGRSSDLTGFTMGVELRKKDRSFDTSFHWWPGTLYDLREIDYTDDGTGIVDAKRLPPGDYEIYSLLFARGNGVMNETWQPRRDLSLPFHVSAGETVYIGNFKAVGLMAKDMLGLDYANGGYWVISNKSARDIPLARAKAPGLREPHIAVIDPDPVYRPYIQSGGR